MSTTWRRISWPAMATANSAAGHFDAMLARGGARVRKSALLTVPGMRTRRSARTRLENHSSVPGGLVARFWTLPSRKPLIVAPARPGELYRSRENPALESPQHKGGSPMEMRPLETALTDVQTPACRPSPELRRLGDEIAELGRHAGVWTSVSAVSSGL